MRPIFPDEVLARLRARHQQLSGASPSTSSATTSRAPTWKVDEARRLRQEEHAKAAAFARETLELDTGAAGRMAKVLPPPHPDGHVEAIDEIVALLERHRATKGVPIEALAQLPAAALEDAVVRAEATEDGVLTTWRARLVLERRAEQGDAQAARTAFAVKVRLQQLVGNSRRPKSASQSTTGLASSRGTSPPRCPPSPAATGMQGGRSATRSARPPTIARPPARRGERPTRHARQLGHMVRRTKAPSQPAGRGGRVSLHLKRTDGVCSGSETSSGCFRRSAFSVAAQVGVTGGNGFPVEEELHDVRSPPGGQYGRRLYRPDRALR